MRNPLEKSVQALRTDENYSLQLPSQRESNEELLQVINDLRLFLINFELLQDDGVVKNITLDISPAMETLLDDNGVYSLYVALGEQDWIASLRGIMLGIYDRIGRTIDKYKTEMSKMEARYSQQAEEEILKERQQKTDKALPASALSVTNTQLRNWIILNREDFCVLDEKLRGLEHSRSMIDRIERVIKDRAYLIQSNLDRLQTPTQA